MVNLNLENNAGQFQYEKWDAKLTTTQKLKTHLRILHMKYSPSQTNEIILEDKESNLKQVRLWKRNPNKLVIL